MDATNAKPLDLAALSRLTEDEAREYMEAVRWPAGPVCPHCGVIDPKPTKLAGKAARPGVWQCNGCREQFTVTVGSVMESSHIPIRSWLIGFHLMCSSKKGISALQLQRNLGLKSYRSAWHMAHRIRHAMATPTPNPNPPMTGTIEADETYIGGKSKGGKCGRGSNKKMAVLALVQRGGNVRVRPIEHVDSKTLKGAIRENVAKSATINTDEWISYVGIGKEFAGGHHTVCHSRGEYCRGDVMTNTAESFFALMKRGVYGVFHHVSKRHLHRYCAEFGFRWDNRKVTDGVRTLAAVKAAEGKRLTYSTPA